MYQRLHSRLFITLLILLFTGSLVRAQTVFKTNLSGSHQVTPVVTKASGEVTATLDGDSLTVTGSFDNLSSQYLASHIHVAYAGRNGGVEIPLDVTVDSDGLGGMYEADSNKFELTAEQKSALMNRQMYVNVHTEQHKAGELRGQLHMQSDAYYRAHLSGNQTVPPIKSRGSGMVVAELDGDSLKVSGSFMNLSSAYTASHIHLGMAGRNGGVEIPLNATVDSDGMGGIYEADSNKYELTADQKSALMNRKLYINLHSESHPASALRGQLVSQSRATFVANISSSQQSPPFKTTGHGTAVLELQGDTLMLSGTFNKLESDFNTDVAGGTHLHVAPFGRNGGVEIGLNADVSSDMRAGVYMPSNNKFGLTAEQIDLLYGRKFYVNIHTKEHEPGSIRGQVLPTATAYFAAHLSGLNEVQPVESRGSGAAIAEFKDSTLILSGAFQGLESNFNADLRHGSHIHAGPVTGNGSIQVELNSTATSSDTAGTYTASVNSHILNNTNIDKLFSGMLYVNVHSEQHVAGELRGQLQFTPNMFPDTSQISSPSDSASVTIEGSASNTFTAEWDQTGDTDGGQFTYIWQLSSSSFMGEASINMNTGTSTMANVTYGKLDTLLMNAGVSVGGKDTLHHRVLTSDGSLHSTSDTRVVIMERGDVMVSIEDPAAGLPDKVRLQQNYPNPFNPTTRIEFALPEATQVQLSIYNMMGQKVGTIADRRFGAGVHMIGFNGKNLSSGIYIYKLTTPTRTLTRKMTLLK